MTSIVEEYPEANRIVIHVDFPKYDNLVIVLDGIWLLNIIKFKLLNKIIFNFSWHITACKTVQFNLNETMQPNKN